MKYMTLVYQDFMTTKIQNMAFKLNITFLFLNTLYATQVMDSVRLI